MDRKLIILSAPSGTGKTSIMKHVLGQGLSLSFSISATNRLPRGNEKNGRDYYFLSTAEFKEKVVCGEFLEWEEVYPGRFYGTLRSEVSRIWADGKSVVFDIDVLGGLNIKEQFGEQALAIFIKPPSMESLRERLEIRGTETEESLKERLAKAEFELSFEDRFDVTVVNERLEKAQQEVVAIVKNFIQ
ncbi:MAG: guanylate kinase [Bacteroidales bacterium]|jgi:guanylate kinase|nr:guanylate kinase [Bacteroidales bacterium]